MNAYLEIALALAVIAILIALGQAISGKKKWYRNMKLLWAFIILKPIAATILQSTFPEQPNAFTFLDRLGAMVNLFWLAVLIYTIFYTIKSSMKKGKE